MSESKRPGRWKPGTSGNPKGKPPGSGELQRLRASIAADVPDILAGLVAAAKGGDVQAARVLLDRTFPAVKPVEHAQAIDLPEAGNLTAQGRAVLSAVALGELAPGQGAQLLAAISSLARVTEIDEMEARLTKLEEKQNASN
jgi:hypothetical protein